MSSTIRIELARESLVLDAQGSVWLPSRETLVVADLHWGKEAAFQAASVSVPSGSTETTCSRLKHLIEKYSASRVLILGDLVHAKSSLSESTQRVIHGLWEAFATVCFELVEGNHDRSSRKALNQWPLYLHAPPRIEPPFCFVHDLDSELPANWDVDDDEKLAIGGHLHPVFRMPDNGEKLKSFVVRKNQLILPAFGELTLGRPLPISSQFERSTRYYLTNGEDIFGLGSGN